MLRSRLFRAKVDLMVEDVDDPNFHTGVVIPAGVLFRVDAIEDNYGEVIARMRDSDGEWELIQDVVVGIPGGGWVVIFQPAEKRGELVSAAPDVCPRLCTLYVEDISGECITFTAIGMDGGTITTIFANADEPVKQLWARIHEAIDAIKPADSIATILPDGQVLADGAVPLRDVLSKVPSFNAMLEASGLAPGSPDVKYDANPEELLGDEEDEKPEAPKKEKSGSEALPWQRL